MELKYIIIVLAVVFLLFIVFGLAIVNYSSEDLIAKFNKTQQYSVGMTPIEFANQMNRLFFGNKIKLTLKNELLCDSFNSRGVLTLSSKYANENNMAGITICAHEFGHAFQCKEQPKKMRSHAKRVRLSKMICRLTSPLFLGGIIALIFSELYIGIGLIAGGVLSFLVAIIAKVSTLNIERDASNRAIELLRVYATFTDEELKIAKKFLNSAKQTYLAELLRVILAWTMLVKKQA